MSVLNNQICIAVPWHSRPYKWVLIIWRIYVQSPSRSKSRELFLDKKRNLKFIVFQEACPEVLRMLMLLMLAPTFPNKNKILPNGQFSRFCRINSPFSISRAWILHLSFNEKKKIKLRNLVTTQPTFPFAPKILQSRLWPTANKKSRD